MMGFNQRNAKILLALSMSALLLVSCSGDGVEEEEAPPPPPPARPSTNGNAVIGMMTAMGGAEVLVGVRSMVSVGGGTRTHLGQVPETGAADPGGVLSGMTEIIDFARNRASVDNDILIGGGFSQHRTEVYTSYRGERIGWGTTEGRPNEATSVNGLFSWAVHNTPVTLLSRNPVTIALAAGAADPDGDAGLQEINGESYWLIEVDMDGEEIGVLIDQETFLLAGFTALDTETMWGDTQSTYLYDDYRPVGDLMLPFSLTIDKEDGQYANIQYDSITVNDASALDILDVPADITNQADAVVDTDGSWVLLNWTQVAANVTHIVAFSHHSMLVEFPSFVVVIEGAYTEAQSLTLARMIEENIGKPIRYVVPTHPHFDHTGGIRGLASVGASVLVAQGHEDELRMIVESDHTNPPDALAINSAAGAEVGQIEVFSGMTEITEGDQTLQLFEVTGIPHVSPKVLAFVPGVGVLFQSDLFFGGPSPDAAGLYQAVESFGLEVEQIVGGHAGILPYSSLVEANTNNDN